MRVDVVAALDELLPARAVAAERGGHDLTLTEVGLQVSPRLLHVAR